MPLASSPLLASSLMDTPADQAVAARVAVFREQKKLRSGSLLVTCLGDAVLPRGGRAAIGSLIRLLAPLGLNERLLRTALYRLRQEGWVTSAAHGRRSDCLLTATGRQRMAAAASQIYAAHGPSWDGCWRFLLLVGELPAAQRETLRRSLFWRGFGGLGNQAYVHPFADLAQIREGLAGEGLEALLPKLLPISGTRPALPGLADDRALAWQAWPLADLAAAYAAFNANYEPLAACNSPAGGLSAEAAFLLRLLLIHDYRRLLLRDPELPFELLPSDWPGHAARALCRQMYHTLLPASEAHLDAILKRADESPVMGSTRIRLRFTD